MNLNLDENKLNCLVKTLLDKTASISERDDAAIDLGNFDNDQALNALLTVASDLKEEYSIMDVCGESIAQIWVKRNQLDLVSYKNLHPNAQYEAKMYIKINKPDWLTYL
ncbi:hypothetical protein [Candidatus Protochlamydia phocaeensis]|uniref:hypothetical protein n=1 Tax=Candidatus Protochlamydia phocaeensis TaxID=1414722 RepID=UPI000838A6CB|nr:hypothetical protein [Candidatus Protochlamydia phocaeensis]